MATKKQPSEAQIAARKKFGEAAKKRAAEAKAKKEQLDQVDERIETTPSNEPDIGDYQKQIDELKAMLLQQQNNNQQAGVQVNNRGMLGTHVKYTVDKGYYSDPIERLFSYMDSKPQLRRFGFKDNYELAYDVRSTKSYERIDGIREVQPQFTLKLIRIVYDDNTYEPTNKRYTQKQMIFFEDPETAVVVARDNGLDVDEENERAFLDEMRFIRMRDWLVDVFLPQPASTPQNLREENIGNQRVSVYEVSSENPATIPFDQMQSKLRT